MKQSQDEDPNVRSNVAFALSSIGEGAKDAVPALRQLLQDKENMFVVLRQGALKRIGGAP
ncbi:TPA: HEAT repeat domain-containing protein [Candidatus Poribacteria bacterium]|nr:HEAT repeat domain-containing protein [Candidatus Poribacteria bacterium]HIA65021.1 HEAT repeat domain-containing protein [Candidatus Poribacteria bacterium]HIC03033.1 HEAT repeat domain-containing protein [Candidatus Poribacteria bacterium]HIO49974.1 HEAT repeat domain-containing protein [Candidatus Poribacteria bacterium]HIO82310.1 HEAT repeat domain-containing protein [Candidatus Poribacteria bacterium]